MMAVLKQWEDAIASGMENSMTTMLERERVNPLTLTQQAAVDMASRLRLYLHFGEYGPNQRVFIYDRYTSKLLLIWDSRNPRTLTEAIREAKRIRDAA